MYAIAEFGSTSRSTSDKYSDRDLLVVCNKDKQSMLYERFSNKGFSVSVLNPEQLMYMKQRGSLFLQHLRAEAKILIDSDGRLARFLNSCELVPPSVTELRKCKGTIKFISSWSDSITLSAWKSDFLYCISRDLLIKTLATKGVVVFGLEDLEREVGLHYGVSKEEFENLRALRKIKAAYRSNNELPHEMVENANAWLITLRHTFDAPLIDASMESLESKVKHLKDRQFNSAYERLRSLEAVYLIARSNNLRHPDHDLLMKHILSPNRYGSSQNRKTSQINKYLCDVIDLLTTTPFQAKHFSLRFASLQMHTG